MPSDFAQGRPSGRRKTLPDLLRQLQAGAPGAARSTSTTPVAGPGRLRGRDASTNRESELERRQRLAREALKQLKGSA